ncbi:MAG: NfeD family protein [Candidatus Brocadiia bacterium]
MQRVDAKHTSSSATWRWPLCLWFVLSLLFISGATAAEDNGPTNYILRLKGIINDARAEVIMRKLESADREGTDVIILELDTPGGTVSASQKLGDFIFKEMDTKVVAYVNTKAYSGGTMVALACDEIYMDERVGMIGDVAPISGGGEEVGEKFQAPIRTTMVNYAEEKGYPKTLIEAMVTKDITVYRVHLKDEPEDQYHYLRAQELDAWSEDKRARIDDKELIVPEGELLTVSASQAIRLGIAKGSVTSPLALYDELGIEADSVQRLYLSAGERALAYLDTFSPLLLMGGLLLLFLEMNQPGLGLPGLLGGTCMVAFFLVKISLHYARMLELLLFAIGILLLMVELFLIPGFGVVGAAGLVCLFISVLLTLQQFSWPTSPTEFEAFQFNIVQAIGIFIGVGFGLLAMGRFMGSLPFLKKLIRTEDMSSATLANPADGSGERANMVGKSGRTLTVLRPAGKARIDGAPVEVVAQGGYIPKDSTVKIIDERGHRLVVTADDNGEDS